MSLPFHAKNISPVEAVALQKEMRNHIDLSPLAKDIKIIGGADISFNKYEDTVYAGIILLQYPEMIPVEQATIKTTTSFPYISGLLAFRELPALLEVLQQLKQTPDLMILDGQGIAHKRRLGIAAHFGLVTGMPSIGCGKTRLTGTYEEPGVQPFSETPLMDRGEQIGNVLRTKKNCKPLFISPGHKVSMQQSLDIIKTCVGKYRIPEPTRLAHLLVNDARIRDKNTSAHQLY